METIEIVITGESSSYVVTDEAGHEITRDVVMWGDGDGRVAESSARLHARNPTVRVFEMVRGFRRRVR